MGHGAFPPTTIITHQRHNDPVSGDQQIGAAIGVTAPLTPTPVAVGHDEAPRAG